LVTSDRKVSGVTGLEQTILIKIKWVRLAVFGFQETHSGESGKMGSFGSF
jgi:hypothetical protein